MMRAWLVAAWRRLAYCRFGHSYMFTRSPQGLTLVCSRCLTRRVVAAPLARIADE